MKKIMGFLKKPSKKSQQQLEQDSAPYQLVSNNNDDSVMSLSSIHQEQPQQPSQQRLAQMNNKQQQQSAPKDPLMIEFGQNAYLVHIFLEDLYKNTFHPSSLKRNPQLKLLNSADKIRLFRQENMYQDIMKFLQSEIYYPSDFDKMTYLSNVYGRITLKSQEDLISEEKVLSLQKTILKSLMDYISISISITQEDPRVLTDFTNPVFDILYAKLSAVNPNGFFYHFIRNLPEENYDSILTPIFKRIIRNTSENSVKKRHDTLISITLLQDLIHCNTKIADFLFQHELHLPPNPTGQDYQKNTVFGVFLSFTIMDNTSSELWPDLDISFSESAKKASVAISYRKKVHESIDAFRKLLESIIKLNPKYKRNILDWLYSAIKTNEPPLEPSSKPEDKFASHGWICNLLVLLLKLCENMLQDPRKYPTLISKIDLNYVFSNPVFEEKFLLDGTRVPECPPQELQESTFSFATELIFAASYASYLFRGLLNAYISASQNIGRLQNLIKVYKNPLPKATETVLRLLTKAKIQLLDPYLMEQFDKLLNFQILLMLNAENANISSPNPSLLFEQLQAPASEKRPPVLKMWSVNVYYYLVHSTITTKKVLPKGFSDLNLLMNFILALMMNKFDTQLHSLRFICFDIIIRLSCSDDEQIGSILKTSPFYEKNLPQALVDNFLNIKEIYAIDKPPAGLHPGRFDPLAACNCLFEMVFVGNPNSYLMRYLKDLSQNNQERYLQFMNIFMDDIITLLDELSLKFAQLNGLPETLTKEQQTSFEKIIKTLGNYHRFAVNVSKYCPEFFLDDIVRDQFAVCLNYSITILNSEGFMGLLQKIEVSEKSPGSFVANIIRVYGNLAHNDDFMQSIINDKENCEIGYFYQIQESSEINQILGDSEKQRFSQLVATLGLLSS